MSISPPPDLDRWCWPHSAAMTGMELGALVARTALFTRRGLDAAQADRLADRLVIRDREGDDRRLCLECVYLSRTAGVMRCAQWKRAGLGAISLPAGMERQLQRCDGFKNQ